MPQKPTKALKASLDELREQGVQFARVDSLKPWKDNPNRHAPGVPRLVRVIQRFGWTIPLVVRAEDREISAGHGRLMAAAEELGLTEVPVIWRSFSAHDSHAYALADNKAPDFSQDDDAALAKVIAELIAADGRADVIDAGYLDSELDELLRVDLPSDEPSGGSQSSGAPAGATGADARSDDTRGADEGAGDEGDEGDGPKPMGTPIIQYNIVFDDEGQQALFYGFLRHLKASVQGETHGARLAEFIRNLNG